MKLAEPIGNQFRIVVREQQHGEPSVQGLQTEFAERRVARRGAG